MTATSSSAESCQVVSCWFCQDREAVGLALAIGGDEHGEAMPACAEADAEGGTAFVALSDDDRRQMFGPFGVADV